MTGPSDPSRDTQRIREEAAGWIARLEGDASHNTRQARDAWLAADPRHRHVYERVAARFANARVLRASRRYRRRAWRPDPVAMMSAAALAAAAAVTLVWIRDDRGPPARFAASGAGAIAVGAPARGRIEARKGDIRSLRLADGSIVTLDTQSALAVDLDGTERRLTLLRGRARFVVAHDGRPFVVRAGGGSVTARGTVFDVAIEPGRRVRVALLRGSVDVAADVPVDAGTVLNVRRLKPGEGAVYVAGRSTVRGDVAAAGETFWPTGMAEFASITLGDLVKRANRYADRPLALADPSLAGIDISGRFRINDPDRLAENLAALLDLEVEQHPDRVLLRRERIFFAP